MCDGIFGKIFGHKMKDIYDIDTDLYNYNDVKDAMNKVTFSSEKITIAKKIIDTPKRTTKVYRCSICQRCGYKINDDLKLFNN